MSRGQFSAVEVKIRFDGNMSVADELGADPVARVRKYLNADHEAEFAVDLPVATDPDGAPILRGTSVAGALRSYLGGYQLGQPFPQLRLRSIDARGAAGFTRRRPALADLLLGSVPEEVDDAGVRTLRPSALRVVTSELSGTICDGPVRTAINRGRGAPEPAKLFRRAHVSGAEVRVLLQLDHGLINVSLDSLAPAGGQSNPEVADVLSALVAALRAWEPTMGGQVSAGSGRARVTSVRTATRDLSRAADLSDLLGSQSTLDFLSTGMAVPPVAQPSTTLFGDQPAAGRRLHLGFTVVDSLLVSSQQAQDDEPNEVTTATIIPATSWRGVLRSRAEYILRSLSIWACPSSTYTCGECPTCQLFGWTPSEGVRNRAAGQADGAVSLITIRDSKVTGVGPDGTPVIRSFPHVAIDRFSGGASDQKLFVQKVIVPPACLALQIEATRAHQPVPDWGWQLLLLAIRDIDRGLIGVGGATTRGCGTLTLTDQSRSELQKGLAGWADSLGELRAEFAAAPAPTGLIPQPAGQAS